MTKLFLTFATLGAMAFLLAACGTMPPRDAPAATSPPRSAAPGPSEPASENYRLDLGSDVVAAFVQGLTPEMPEKVAYVTHVPSGSQVILNPDGKIVERHDGRADGPSRLDAVLGEETQMARITAVLTNGEDASPQSHTITWVPMVRFGGIQYMRRWNLIGKITRADHADLAEDHLGPELYRIAFRLDGYAGAFYRSQDGDATFLNPGRGSARSRGTHRSSGWRRWREEGRPSMKPTPILPPKSAGTCWTYGARSPPLTY